ncbi:hypothetical protein LOD99_15417 [Oopsacas minuta]|uniref:Peptidylprolyl isomerase n=1 Tax=Oopsacas minuta TaxID=111878 RepID=A0AAV7KBV4_9METZ|nr:hypothetical protein LOD99_15417 [Oopsacas minuta]
MSIQGTHSQSTRSPEGQSNETGGNENIDVIDLEERCGIEIDRYQFKNLVTGVRIRNSVTIHYAGYFLKTEGEYIDIFESCKKYTFEDKTATESQKNSPNKTHTNSPSVSPRKYRPRADQEDPDGDPIPLWRADSVISLLEKEHRMILFCSTWPEHGDKVLPGPVTFTLGGETAPLVPSLIVAVKRMRIGEIKVVHVPPAEVYGLDMSPVKQRVVPDKKEEKTKGVNEQETRGGIGERGTHVKGDKQDIYYSSSSEEDYDPDEEFSEPWCDAPGTKGDRATFFRSANPHSQQPTADNLEVHRGLAGIIYVVQLLALGESQPDREIIHVKKPLETDKKTDKSDVGNKDK